MSTQSALRSIRLSSNCRKVPFPAGTIQRSSGSVSSLNAGNYRDRIGSTGGGYRPMSTGRGVVTERSANITGTLRSQGPDEGTFSLCIWLLQLQHMS